jgi:DUF4097 and DUF4098 domain-containing protein YvlB
VERRRILASYRSELPSEGLVKVDVEIWRGNLSVRTAQPGEVAAVESDWELNVTTEDGTLNLRQRLDAKRPLDLADIIGEQQIRIEIEGMVLLDKQIRHGGGDVQLILPASVRVVRCRTSRGDIRLDGVDAAAEVHTVRGTVCLSGGHGQALAGTSSGDVKVAGWYGDLKVHSGRGNLDIRNTEGHLVVRASRGEIRIENAGDGVDARTNHGNLVIDRIFGKAKLSTGHGDILATDLGVARLEASTGHGRITLAGKIADGNVKTGQGDIVCRLVSAKGDNDLRTGRGDISLDMHERVSARIDASTKHGGIDSNLRLVKVGTSGPSGLFSQRLVGTSVGSEPNANIHLSTRHGDIRIFRREEHIFNSDSTHDWKWDGATTERHPVEKGSAVTVSLPLSTMSATVGLDQSPSQLPAVHTEPWRETVAQRDKPRNLELEILDAVSRGELSVDEALVLLESSRDESRGTGREPDA